MEKREPILYIDDEKENLSSFRLLFGDVYEIFLANKIDEVYTILSENEIKVLISDQKMPKKTTPLITSLFPVCYTVLGYIIISDLK